MPGPLSTARKRAVERDDVAKQHVAAAVLAGNAVAGLATGPLEELRIAQFFHKGPGTAWSGVEGADSPLVGFGATPQSPNHLALQGNMIRPGDATPGPPELPSAVWHELQLPDICGVAITRSLP